MRSAPAQAPGVAANADDLLRRWVHVGDVAIAGRVAIATRSGGGWSELTYRALDDRSRAMAASLAQVGVGAGDRVALLAEPGGDWAVAFFGILRAGAVAVLLDTKLTAGELGSLCRRSGLAAAVSTAGRWPDRTIPVFDPATAGVGTQPEVARTVDDPAVIVWTSGTTGEPKGVTLSLANLAYVVEASSAVQRPDRDTRWLSVLPPHHLLELCCGLLPALAAGSTTFVARTIVPGELASMLADCHVTRMVVVPMVLHLLRRHIEGATRVDLGPLSTVYCGGAPLDPEVVDFFDRLGIAVYPGYGLTEAAPAVSMNSPGGRRSGSVGRPLPGTTVHISADGEILVEGPGVMLGYWDDEDATREALDRSGSLRTGDLGHLDSEGYLFVTGRIKSLIVLDSGKKVQPEEVETVLSQGDRFAEVCVVGWRATNGPYGGEQVCAVVVPEGRMSEEEAAGEVRRLSAPLSPFKRPTMVRAHEGPLPRTVKRSLRRAEVARWLDGTQ